MKENSKRVRRGYKQKKIDQNGNAELLTISDYFILHLNRLNSQIKKAKNAQ